MRSRAFGVPIIFAILLTLATGSQAQPPNLSAPPITIGGLWPRSTFGPITFKTSAELPDGSFTFTGTWEQGFDGTGIIGNGIYNPETHAVAFRYVQPWNATGGIARFVLSEDGRQLTGQYRHLNGFLAGWEDTWIARRELPREIIQAQCAVVTDGIPVAGLVDMALRPLFMRAATIILGAAAVYIEKDVIPKAVQLCRQLFSTPATPPCAPDDQDCLNRQKELERKSRIALGLDRNLSEFATDQNAMTYQEWADGSNFSQDFFKVMNNSENNVFFNLDGIENVDQAIQSASARGIDGGYTNWELLQIRNNPQWWDRIQFFRNGNPEVNPFQR